jgi:hypothetical protein
LCKTDFGNGEEDAIKVVVIRNGAESCTVGYLAKGLVEKHKKMFVDKFAQVTALYDFSPSRRRRERNKNFGMASFHLLEKVLSYEDSGDAIPRQRKRNPKDKRPRDGEIEDVLNTDDNGSSLCLAHRICGESLEPNDVIRFRFVFKTYPEGMRSTLKAVRISDGIETCLIGYLPRKEFEINGDLLESVCSGD